VVLRDLVIAINEAGDELATLRAHVYYRTAALDTGERPIRLTMVEQLAAITEPWEWDYTRHRVRFRGEDYEITGALWRRRNGRDHHVTLNLERITG